MDGPDLNATNHLAVGTTTQLVVITDGTLQDITPQTLLSDFAANFSTIINTPTVTVIDPNISNVTTLDAVFFNTPISVGGIILQGLFPISEIVGTHSYQIIAPTNATSTVNNAGAQFPAFTTTSGSASVSVALTAHGESVGNTFDFFRYQPRLAELRSTASTRSIPYRMRTILRSLVTFRRRPGRPFR